MVGFQTPPGEHEFTPPPMNLRRASALEWTCSFLKMLSRCQWTVPLSMKSLLAMSPLDAQLNRSSMISRSRSLSVLHRQAAPMRRT